jgi:phosphoribosylformimino-5-aminoimidazole carboxamide ribotide isomerase
MGVDRVVVGTRAVGDADWFRQLCLDFPGRIELGVDARHGMVATEGWTQTSEVRALELARRFDDLPLAALIYTDIGRDGMMGGANLAAVAEMAEAVRTPVIASGGVTTLEDIRALAQLRIAGCIVGRALYEGTIRLSDAIDVARTRDHPRE